MNISDDISDPAAKLIVLHINKNYLKGKDLSKILHEAFKVATKSAGLALKSFIALKTASAKVSVSKSLL